MDNVLSVRAQLQPSALAVNSGQDCARENEALSDKSIDKKFDIWI